MSKAYESYESTLSITLKARDLLRAYSPQTVLPKAPVTTSAPYVDKELLSRYLYELENFKPSLEQSDPALLEELTAILLLLRERYENHLQLNQEIYSLYKDAIGAALLCYGNTPDTAMHDRISDVVAQEGNKVLAQLDFYLYDCDSSHYLKAVQAIESIINIVLECAPEGSDLHARAESLSDRHDTIYVYASLANNRSRR